MNLCFVKLIGSEIEGFFRYEFIFSDEINNIEINNGDYFPACLVNNVDVLCGKTETHVVKTKIKFSLIQDNCCFSFLHAKIGCVALAWENIDDYEEYPTERGRLVFMFGETYENIEEKLATKGILFIN